MPSFFKTGSSSSSSSSSQASGSANSRERVGSQSPDIFAMDPVSGNDCSRSRCSELSANHLGYRHGYSFKKDTLPEFGSPPRDTTHIGFTSRTGSRSGGSHSGSSSRESSYSASTRGALPIRSSAAVTEAVTEGVPSSGFSDQLTPGGYSYREGTHIHTAYHTYKNTARQASLASSEYNRENSEIPNRKGARNDPSLAGKKYGMEKNYNLEERMYPPLSLLC